MNTQVRDQGSLQNRNSNPGLFDFPVHMPALSHPAQFLIPILILIILCSWISHSLFFGSLVSKHIIISFHKIAGTRWIANR